MKKLLLIVMTIFVLGAIPVYATPEQDTIDALTALENHILGNPTITDPNVIAAHKATIDTNQALFGTDSGVITSGFSFVDTYDIQIGALWVQGSPVQSINRDTITDSDIEWSVWNVMQYIMDYTYNTSNVATYETLLDGKLFDSSSHFPGYVDPAAQRTTSYSVDINADYPDTVGWTRFQEGVGNFSRKPTGTYAAAGDIVDVTVPASLVNQGYRIRVGCNSWDFSTSGPGPLKTIKRLDRVSLVYDITSTTTKVSNPLGGGIYIEVPFDTAGSVETIQITNAVHAPFFSVNSVTGNNTTVADWQNIERNYPAPWADFQTEKFMMSVPTDWIYALDTPDVLMADWDTASDVYNDLMGFPRIQGRENFYLHVDLSLRGTSYYPGWPQGNVSYNPDTSYGGLANSPLTKGPQFADSYLFHEEGHGYMFPKFPGETESAVNLGHVAIWNQGFGYDLDYAFAGSRSQEDNSYHTLDNTAVVWMTSLNFVNGNPMGEKEKKYQLPGHAKFVNIARVFGWQVLNDYFKSFVDYYEETGTSKPFDQDTDEHILRLSIAADCDLTPLLYFWGIHPVNAATLAADIAAANLTNSSIDTNKIYDEIYRYTEFVPDDNAEFQEYALSWWERVPDPNATDQAEREDAQQWDTYDSASHDAIVAQINNILATYYSGGDPIPDTGGPLPDPEFFAIEPTAESDTTISMTAVTGRDDSGDYVEYYFDETSGNPGGTDSGWQLSPSYIDTGLNPNTQYTYTVQTRDIYLNTSTVSAPVSATTNSEGSVLNFKASDPASGVDSSNWDSLTDDNSSDWALGSGITLEDITSNVPTISKAYHFDHAGAVGTKWGLLYNSQIDATWEIWVKPADTGDPYQTIFESGGGSKGVGIWYTVGTAEDNSGTINFTVCSDNLYTDTVSAVIDTTEFHHIVCDFDQDYNGSVDRLRIYVDGVLAADNKDTTAPTNISSWLGGDLTAIGMTSSVPQLGSSGGYFTGDLSVLRFWQFTSILSDAKVAQLYTDNFTSTPDTTPPTPNPATFSVDPTLESGNVITMTATTATDASGLVEYYFDETSGNTGGTDSGWQLSPTYTDTGLDPVTEYTYTVQTRDALFNTGVVSAPASVTTVNIPVLDFNASDPYSGVDSANWLSLTVDSSKDWTFGAGITLENVTSNVSAITQAYRFAGAGVTGDSWDDYTPTSDSTWEIWVKPADTGDPYQTIFESGANVNGMAIWYTVGTPGDNTGTINFTVDGGTVYDTVSAVIDTTEFRHIVMDFDNDYDGSVDRLKIFVDGVLVADNTATNPTDIVLWSGSDPSGLGMSSGGAQEGSQQGLFTGDLSVLRFWQFPNPLTDADVAQLYSDYFTGIPDTTPPTPNPATFAVAPAADSDSAISMTATTGSDASGPVEYLFTETSGNPGGTSSGWQTSTSYTDTGLDPETQYTYTITMRDSLGNTGSASAPANVSTDPAPDTTPPTPNPATFAVAPAADSDTAISMTATTGSDASGPVEYLFTETSGNPGGTSSGWQTSASYTDTGLDPATQYTYTVTMRDSLGNTGTASSPASATTDSAQATMYVQVIDLSVVNAGGPNRLGQAVVTIYDNLGQPLSGVTVYGTFTGSYNESGSAVTNANGQATITTISKAKNPSFTFTVDNLTASGYTYDSASNVETSDNY